MAVLDTGRLLVRPPSEPDRGRFVELFTDEAFTVFSDGAHDVDSAHRRFDHMLSFADAIPYAKQPIVEKITGAIVGYTGVGNVVIVGQRKAARTLSTELDDVVGNGCGQQDDLHAVLKD